MLNVQVDVRYPAQEMAYCGCATGPARLRWAAVFLCFVAAAAVLGLMAREVRQCGVCKSLPDVSTEQITRFNCTSFPDLGQKEGDYMEDGRRALLQTA